MGKRIGGGRRKRDVLRGDEGFDIHGSFRKIHESFDKVSRVNRKRSHEWIVEVDAS